MVHPLHIYDGHIHLYPEKCDTPEQFREKALKAGIVGGMIISDPPADSPEAFGKKIPARRRMERVRDYCVKCGADFFPCYWIDPLEKNAVRQVVLAKETGMRALKVQCSRHAPSAGLSVYREAARLGLPILFHSGTLWDDAPSANFNRPAEFECMLDVPGVRFALAHIAWPWTDECIAVYGKLRQAGHRYGRHVEIYIDDSPGTPDIYRENVFRNFAFLGYDLSDTLLFGSDCSVNAYDWGWAKYTLDFDRRMFSRLNRKFQTFQGYRAEGSFMAASSGKPDLNRLWRNSVSENLLRFLGVKS